MKIKHSWNYRVIKMADTKLKGLPQTYSWAIYEVYYDNDKPTIWTSTPIHPRGESLDDLLRHYHDMFEAFVKPVLIVKNNKLIRIK